MKIRGRVWRFGENVDTDVIIPARYLNTSDPSDLAKHCMEDADPEFAGRVRIGDIIVAGKNFGCGSSREHAPIALKAAGVGCVVAPSFARIFYRNAFNMGLAIFESEAASAALRQGDEVEVDATTGLIRDISTGEVFEARPIPAFMQALIDDGGLIPHVLKRQRSESGAGC